MSRSLRVAAAYLGLLGVAVLWGALRGNACIYQLRPLAWPRVLINLTVGVGLGLCVVFVSRFAVHRFEWARRLHREFRFLLGPLSRQEIIILALASSVAEEGFFRGALLPHLGLWLSSVLFALPHIGPGLRFLPWTVSSFVMGLVFGCLFSWGGDLTGPIAAHFIINALNLGYIARHELG